MWIDDENGEENDGWSWTKIVKRHAIKILLSG